MDFYSIGWAVPEFCVIVRHSPEPYVFKFCTNFHISFHIFYIHTCNYICDRRQSTHAWSSGRVYVLETVPLLPLVQDSEIVCQYICDSRIEALGNFNGHKRRICLWLQCTAAWLWRLVTVVFSGARYKYTYLLSYLLTNLYLHNYKYFYKHVHITFVCNMTVVTIFVCSYIFVCSLFYRTICLYS